VIWRIVLVGWWSVDLAIDQINKFTSFQRIVPIVT
jgi:hypothetical protein